MVTAALDDRRIGGAPSVPPVERTDDQPPRVWPRWAIKMKWDYEAKIAQLERRIAELEESVMHTAQQQRALATLDRRVSLYGTEQVLQEMTVQVALSPKFQDLSPAEQRYVAMVGLVTGLTPEFYLHAWRQKKRVKTNRGWEDQEVLTVMPDYKALIVRSRPLMEKVRRLTADEMRARGIPEQDIQEGSIAYVIEGYELDQALKCRQAGIPYEPKTGFGWWPAMKTVNDARKPNDVPNGRDGAWVAEKRARRDLYNQFADLTISLPSIRGATLEDGDVYVFDAAEETVIEGSFTPRPADWLTPPAIARAEAYRDERHVTDEQINAWLKVSDWRQSPITAEEFKIAVDQLAMQAGLDGGERLETLSEPEPPTAPKPAAKTEPKRCANCGLEAAVETPLGDDYCDTCAKRLADNEAARS